MTTKNEETLPEDVARDVEQVRSTLVSMAMGPQRVEAELASLSRLASAAAQVPGLETEVERLKERCKAEVTKALTAESERDALKAELAASEDASGMYAERSGRFAEQADRLEKERDAAQRDLVGVINERDALKESLADARQTTSEERRLREYAEDESAVSRARLAKSEQEAEAAREQLRDLSVENERLTAQVEAWKENCGLIGSSGDPENVTPAHLAADLQKRDAEVATLTARVAELERQRDAAHESERHATDCFKESEARATAAEAKVQELEERLEAAEATLDDEEAAHAETLDMLKTKPNVQPGPAPMAPWQALHDAACSALNVMPDSRQRDALVGALSATPPVEVDSHPTPAPGLREAVAKVLRGLPSDPNMVEEGPLRRAVVRARADLQDAYDAAKGGEARRTPWARSWKTLAKQYRGAENYYRAMRNGHQKLFAENKEKARKWDAAMAKATDDAIDEWLDTPMDPLNPPEDQLLRMFAGHLGLTSDTHPSGPGGGERSHTEECEANEDDTDGNAGPCTCAPLTPESLAAVVEGLVLDWRFSDPVSERSAREVLRRALAGNAPRVLREERVVEVLAAYVCPPVHGLLSQSERAANNMAQSIARDLNLALPGGKPAPKPPPANRYCPLCGVECESCGHDAKVAPEVVWEGDGVRVMEDGTWEMFGTNPVLHVEHQLARALAEAKRELKASISESAALTAERDAWMDRCRKARAQRDANANEAVASKSSARKAAEAQRKACADAVLRGRAVMMEAEAEAYYRVANEPLVTG